MPTRALTPGAPLPASNHFRGNIIAALTRRAHELGVPCTPWFDGLRLSEGDFADTSALPLLSHREACTLLRRALLSLPGSGHGLVLGSRQSLANFGVLGLAMLSEPSFGAALRTGIRYAPASGAMLQLSLADDPAGIAVIARMYSPDPLLEVYLCEELIASCVNLCRSLLGDGFCAERIELAYPAPAHADRYAMLPAREIRFGCMETRVVLAQRWLQAPMPAANPDSARLLAALCRAQMPPGQPIDSLATLVEQRLALSPARAPKLTELAGELHLTERTLRRQLQAEGYRYRDLLDRVRARSARRLLGEQQLPLEQVAAAVGFADVRDFRRAFKRWTGCLPGDYRRGQAAGMAQPSTISASTSNAAPLGSAETSMVERAG